MAANLLIGILEFCDFFIAIFLYLSGPIID